MPPTISTRFTRDYGVTHPIAQAPMAFVSTPPNLAVAVCAAGGIGSLAIGPAPADVLRALVGATRAATNRPFNVNFITFLCDAAKIQACVDERVPIVSFHWGHPPREWITALKAAGIKVWEQVGSVAAAKEAVAAGVDLIVAQGTEAGGHNFGSLSTFELVPSIVEAVAPVPVLAAGGIATGRQLAAALMLGADGVSIGTRFVASDEGFAHAEYKRRLVAAESTETRLSSVYGPDMVGFNPMRVLDTGLAREFAERENDAPSNYDGQPIIATMKLAGAEIPLPRFSNFVPTPDTEGQIELLPFLAGQGVGLIHEIAPVATIVDRLMTDARAAIDGVGR